MQARNDIRFRIFKAFVVGKIQSVFYASVAAPRKPYGQRAAIFGKFSFRQRGYLLFGRGCRKIRSDGIGNDFDAAGIGNRFQDDFTVFIFAGIPRIVGIVVRPIVVYGIRRRRIISRRIVRSDFATCETHQRNRHKHSKYYENNRLTRF